MSDRRVAVDTTILVNYFTRGGNDPRWWLQHSAWVMRAAERGEFRLVVPALAVAELAGDGAIRGQQLPKGERRDRLRRVRSWLTSGPYLVVDIDALVASQAADLAIEHQLKGADACVVAAARRARADVLLSWDNDHLKLDGALSDLAVRQPEAQEEQGEIGELPSEEDESGTAGPGT